MSLTTETLPTRGDPISARFMRNLVRAVRENQLALGQLRVTSGAMARIVRVEIKTINPTNLICVGLGQAAVQDTAEYTVELPPRFRDTSRGGRTYTYTDINNRVADGTENQQLTEQYLVGDELTIHFFGDKWIDANIDGRMWAKVP